MEASPKPTATEKERLAKARSRPLSMYQALIPSTNMEAVT